MIAETGCAEQEGGEVHKYEHVVLAGRELGKGDGAYDAVFADDAADGGAVDA